MNTVNTDFINVPNGKTSKEYVLQNFLLIIKENNSEALQTAEDIKAWLEKNFLSATIVSAFIPEEELLKHTETHDIAVILGGDGTILGISRRM